jgi:hypothetical protein
MSTIVCVVKEDGGIYNARAPSALRAANLAARSRGRCPSPSWTKQRPRLLSSHLALKTH